MSNMTSNWNGNRAFVPAGRWEIDLMDAKIPHSRRLERNRRSVGQRRSVAGSQWILFGWGIGFRRSRSIEIGVTRLGNEMWRVMNLLLLSCSPLMFSQNSGGTSETSLCDEKQIVGRSRSFAVHERREQSQTWNVRRTVWTVLLIFSLRLFSKESIRHKEIAGLESQIYRLVELLNEQRLATLDNVRRKQAKAGEENEDDEDADGGAISDEDSDHEEDGLIYNPKNLPLGWDGKVRPLTTSPH